MPRPSGLALLLSRIGAKVSADFADRTARLDLTPAQVGVLRVVGQTPGIGQQELAARIGSVPSRVTKLVDELEAKGLLARERNAADRRNVELRPSSAAGDRLRQVYRMVGQHDARLVAALTADELSLLMSLLGKVARALGMDEETHSGYSGR